VRPRDNPFSVQRLARLEVRLQGADWATLETRLAALGHRAALVAPEGHGKSRLLVAFAARLAARGHHPRHLQLRSGQRWLRRSHWRTLLADPGANDFWLVDGAEQLSPLAWHWLRWRARAAAGLVITSHRAGLLPTWWEPRTSPELLAELVAELLAATAGEGAGALPTLPDLDRLWADYGGDLRAALLALYDHCARG
jgi:hypothetical protein